MPRSKRSIELEEQEKAAGTWQAEDWAEWGEPAAAPAAAPEPEEEPDCFECGSWATPKACVFCKAPLCRKCYENWEHACRYCHFKHFPEIQAWKLSKLQEEWSTAPWYMVSQYEVSKEEWEKLMDEYRRGVKYPQRYFAPPGPLDDPDCVTDHTNAY